MVTVDYNGGFITINAKPYFDFPGWAIGLIVGIIVIIIIVAVIFVIVRRRQIKRNQGLGGYGQVDNHGFVPNQNLYSAPNAPIMNQGFNNQQYQRYNNQQNQGYFNNNQSPTPTQGANNNPYQPSTQNIIYQNQHANNPYQQNQSNN